MSEVYNYCTLFDSGYLDRGVVMIKSLNRVGESFKIYVLAMDEICYKILNEMMLPNTIVISMEEFEDSEISAIRKNRTHQEFCWSCSSAFLSYLFKKKGVHNCTYIDADMFFYSCPNKLVQEVMDNNCSVGIMKHNFPRNMEGTYARRKSGTYCVEFNTFLDNKIGQSVLEWWKRKCIDSCNASSDEKVFGDQLYLEKWPEIFEGIYVQNDKGSGIAPWNIMNYKYGRDGKSIIYRPSGEKIKLIFYHFHCLKFENSNSATIGVYTREGKKDSRLIQDLYNEYIRILIEERKIIEERYGYKSTCHMNASKTEKNTTLFEKVKKINLFLILNWILVKKNASKDRIEIR